MSGSSRLTKLVDFSDLDGSEAKLRAELETATGDDKLEVETQIARVMGLNGNYDQALELLAQVRFQMPEGNSRVRVRVELEEGRCHRDQHQVAEALACFERAMAAALEIQDEYLAMDAAHMVAITGDSAQQIEAGEHALKLVERIKDLEAKHWLGPILNNLGWTYLDAGQYDRALEQFQHAVEVRREGPKRPFLIARYTVAHTLRMMGRFHDALAELPDLQRDNIAEGGESPFVHEEIAECLYGLGKNMQAKVFFRKAYKAMSQMNYLVTGEPERLNRIKMLAE
jgi:tetratricopeptide (TPR) repeat protein